MCSAHGSRGSHVAEQSVRRYLSALYGNAPDGALIEVRYRRASGMGQTFHSARDLHAVTRQIIDRAADTDVYVGVLPRRRRGGRRDDVAPSGGVLWADCDDGAAAAALRRFSPRPSIVVHSGGGAENCHAYWLLREQHPVRLLEAANRHLAAKLGADTSCADGARVLRPPSNHHGQQPPAPVVLETCVPSRRYSLAEVVGHLPEPPAESHRSPRVSEDPLLEIPPRLYVEVIAGVSVGRDGKANCPFHANDRTASLHAYREPARGWYCYGCRRGGSIFDLAAAKWNLSTRGSDFIELADRLCQIFDPAAIAP